MSAPPNSQPEPAPRRIVVVGTSGAGKSTLARALAAAERCPYIELDALYWGPQWQARARALFQQDVAQATDAPAWVADGNYAAVRELVWSRATTLVWLRYSLPRVLWQVFVRTVRRSLTREPLWHGNRESLTRALFSKDSILLWAAQTHHRRERDLLALRASGRFAHLQWLEFRNPRQARQWLAARQYPA